MIRFLISALVTILVTTVLLYGLSLVSLAMMTPICEYEDPGPPFEHTEKPSPGGGK